MLRLRRKSTFYDFMLRVYLVERLPIRRAPFPPIRWTSRNVLDPRRDLAESVNERWRDWL